jgi:uncharacterized protein (DUF58 family)
MSEQNSVEGIQLLAKQAVEGFIIGLHKSPFHGFSVEFSEHRVYNIGDNLKHIDWKVYGKSDKLFVKKYEEETNLRCQILLDTSGSMHFPEKAKYYNKLQFSAIAAAAIAEILKGQQDACGVTLFDDSISYHSACKSSGMHYNNLMVELNTLLNMPIPRGKSTRTADIIHEIAEKIHRRSLVIIFSDMMDRYSEMEELIQAIQHLKHNKHEVLIFQVMDKAKEVELELSNKPYKFVDLETGESIKMNNLQIKDYYVTQMRKMRQELEIRLGQMSIDLVDADINQPLDQILTAYFLKRNKLV